MQSLVTLVHQAQTVAGLRGSGMSYHNHSCVVTFPVKDHLCPANACAVGVLSATLKQHGIRHRVIRWHVGYGVWGKAVIVPKGFFI